MFAFLSAQWVKYVAILGAALALFGGGIFVANTWYDRGAQHQALLDKAQAAKAVEADQVKNTEAVHSDDQELLALRAYRDSHPDIPVSVRPQACLPGSQPAGTQGAAGAPATAAHVLAVPAADPVGNLTDADRGRLLEDLAAAADADSAQLRAIQAVR